MYYMYKCLFVLTITGIFFVYKMKLHQIDTDLHKSSDFLLNPFRVMRVLEISLCSIVIYFIMLIRIKYV